MGEDEFVEIDTSKDGVISYNEFRAYLDKELGKSGLTAKLESQPSFGFGASEKLESACEQAPTVKTESTEKLEQQIDESFSKRCSALRECSRAVDDCIDKLLSIKRISELQRSQKRAAVQRSLGHSTMP